MNSPYHSHSKSKAELRFGRAFWTFFGISWGLALLVTLSIVFWHCFLHSMVNEGERPFTPLIWTTVGFLAHMSIARYAFRWSIEHFLLPQTVRKPDTVCPNCNMPRRSDSRFCRDCGAALRKPVIRFDREEDGGLAAHHRSGRAGTMEVIGTSPRSIFPPMPVNHRK